VFEASGVSVGVAVCVGVDEGVHVGPGVTAHWPMKLATAKI
jgi:hypothetical protein